MSYRSWRGRGQQFLFLRIFFTLLLALGLTYIFLPDELVAILRDLPPVTFEGGFLSGIIYALYLLSRPLLWSTTLRILLGIIVTGGVWALMFLDSWLQQFARAGKVFGLNSSQAERKSEVKNVCLKKSLDNLRRGQCCT